MGARSLRSYFFNRFGRIFTSLRSLFLIALVVKEIFLHLLSPGPRFLVSPVPGSWVLGSWFLALRPRFLVLGSWFLVLAPGVGPGSWFLVLGLRSLVLGSGFLVLGSCCWLPSWFSVLCVVSGSFFVSGPRSLVRRSWFWTTAAITSTHARKAITAAIDVHR